jgi:hypothetical protein
MKLKGLFAFHGTLEGVESRDWMGWNQGIPKSICVQVSATEFSKAVTVLMSAATTEELRKPVICNSLAWIG